MSGSQSQEKFAAGEDRRVPYEEFGESRLVVCDYCDVELELSDEELAQGWYVCPECNELSHLATTGDDLLDPSGVSGRDEDNYRGAADRPGETVECGHCLEIVILPDLQAKQGWFFCPHCQGLGQLDDYVTCLSCGSKLELVEEEWAQEWYRCPECGQVTHLVDSAGKEMDSRTSALKEQSPVLEPADQETDHDWVQLKTAVGPEEAALEVAFLRANGVEAFTWQQGAGQTIGLTGELLGAFHIMVRKDQEQEALSIRGNLVECQHCRESLTISDHEVTQEWFVCPVCQNTCYMSDTVTCLACGNQLDTEEAEREQRWYRCPECDRLNPMKILNKLVNCGYCGDNLELSDQEVIQGWFVCPMCHEMGFFGGPVTCLSCGNRKDLDKEEWQQGWYHCPKCEQITHLVDVITEVADTAPQSLDQGSDDDCIQSVADWVKLKQVTSAEEAARLAYCLRANGIEAFTRRGSAKGAFGLAIDTLSTSHVMVQENQKQLALALLEVEVEEGQHSHPAGDCAMPDVSQSASSWKAKDR